MFRCMSLAGKEKCWSHYAATAHRLILYENSFRKACARTFRKSSGEFAQQVKDNPNTAQVHLANVIAAQGALPIKVWDEVIGAVGVSGAPGGEKDEACSKAGIDKIANDLK